MQICPRCGSDVPDGCAFCGSCGGRLPSEGGVPGPPVEWSAPPPPPPAADLVAQDRPWVRSHPGLAAVLTAVLLIGAGAATLFTVGYPMGWPLGPGFNMLFLVLGGVFTAVGVHSLLRPGTVRVGGTTRFGHLVGGRAATRREGRAFGLLFVATGVGMTLVAILMGLLIGNVVSLPSP